MKIYLSTPYFRSSDDARQAEYDSCLKGNIDNPHIDKIFLFIDDGHVPDFVNGKANVIHIDQRLTYADWLSFTADFGLEYVSILSNTDILFDETVSELKTILARRNRFVALSRYEKEGDQLTPHPRPRWSQDVWAVNGASDITPALIKAADFPLGVPRCDNKIVYEFAMHGWDLINPFPTVRAIHFHESQIRNYQKEMDRTIVGGMGFISPQSDFHRDSDIEVTIWPRKAGHISKLRIVDALEIWDRQKTASKPAARETVFAHDRDWQYPAITEKRAYDNIKKRKSIIPQDCAYFGFPWATLLDKLANKKDDASALIETSAPYKEIFRQKRCVVTTCQHIRMLKFQHIFDDSGVTDIFWSHAVKGQEVLPDYPAIRIHPFPLFPVQVPQKADDPGRNTLFSFVGARAKDFYLTQVRNFILDELAEDKRGVIVGRDDWHYNKIVYDHQIRARAKKNDALLNEQASVEFQEVLKKSIFSLCPSGSGPNSIRLWESIGAGAIPVILAETHALPGNQDLWKAAAVFCGEDRESVKALPDKLEAIANDKELLAQKRHALRQLWMLYKPESFTSDIEAFFLKTSAGEGGALLPLSNMDLLTLCEVVLDATSKDPIRDETLLNAASSRMLLDRETFEKFYATSNMLRKALDEACERCDDKPTVKAWNDVAPKNRPTEITGRGDPFLKIALLGRSVIRTPFAYAPYKKLFSDKVQYTSRLEQAHTIIFGSGPTIREHTEQLLDTMKADPAPHLAVVSEEPLWDTTWGMEFGKSAASVHAAGELFDYSVLNHFTTSIFEFEKLPYFVTTDDNYFIRYSNMFRRNASLAPEELLALWKNADWRAAFFAEKRHDKRYDFEYPEDDLYGLSAYRTRLAEATLGDGVLTCGKGWKAETRRQDLPDWHLDKLATLDKRSFIVSALENTHQRDYITEKIFDAYAVLGVPVYYASRNHRITELVPVGSFINLFGRSAEEGGALLSEFEPDLAFVKTYQEAQRRLCELFAKPQTLMRERRRVVNETMRWLDQL